MPDGVSVYLADKLSEYRTLAAPLERAGQEIDYSHRLLRARLESEIAERVPVLGTLADVLDISLLDLLNAPDRSQFMQEAMTRAGLTVDDVMQQLRALGPPPPREELGSFGLIG